MVETILVTLAAGAWGAVGGFIYWAVPKRPEGAIKFTQRVGGGFVAGALAFAILGVTPFDAMGAWDATGIGKLVGLGLTGIAGVASFLGPYLNENARKQLEQLQAAEKELRALKGP